MAYPYKKRIKPRLGALPKKGHRLSKGLVGMWLMNEGAGTTVADLSGNRSTGTLVADTFWTAGKFGSALNFDGDSDYVDLGDPNIAEGVTKATISVWFNTPVIHNLDTLISNTSSSGNRPWELRFRTGDLLEGVFNTTKVQTPALSLNTWHHVVIVADGVDMSIYLDGQFIESTPFTATLETSTACRIGSNPETGARYYHGLIGNVTVYNRALTAREIAQLYREPFAMFQKEDIAVLSPLEVVDIVRYVDTGSDAGGDGTTSATSSGDNTHAYQSLFAWEAAEQQDLTAGGGSTMTVHCNRTNGGGKDQIACYIRDWTTGVDNYITIIGDDFPTDGVWDDTKYILENNDDQLFAIRIRVNYVRVINIQALVTTTSGDKNGFYIGGGDLGASNDVRFDSCIAKGVCSGTGASSGFNIGDGATKLFNCISYGFVSGGDSGFYGIYLSTSEGSSVYNCTAYGNYRGIRLASGSANITNCAVGNNTDDFMGGTIDHCISDDGDGTNAQNPLGGDWANEFVNPGTDFNLKSGGNCVENGTDDPGSGLYSDDIIGIARSSIWDIGAFEFVAVVTYRRRIIIS